MEFHSVVEWNIEWCHSSVDVNKLWPFLRPQTQNTQQKRSPHSCSPGLQDYKNPGTSYQVFFSMYKYVCKLIYFIKLASKRVLNGWHTWIWATPFKKSSNSIIIESVSLFMRLVLYVGHKSVFLQTGSNSVWAKLHLSHLMPLSHVHYVHIQLNIPRVLYNLIQVLIKIL